MPNVKSVRLKTKDLLTYHCYCHGNLVTIAAKYVADAYRDSKMRVLEQTATFLPRLWCTIAVDEN